MLSKWRLIELRMRTLVAKENRRTDAGRELPREESGRPFGIGR